MAEVNVVGVDLANLQIMEEPLVLNEDAVSTDLNYELCLVGRSTKGGDSISGPIMDHGILGAALITKRVTKYMWIRVLLDVKSPLKRKKKISTGRNQCIYVLFQYEKLPLFCFLYGRLRHGENFCPIRLILSDQQVEFGWNISLKATPRRGRQVVSRWLRDDTDEGRWTCMELEGEPGQGDSEMM
ncbi:hypothetical protein PVK06_031728 [Gossypium arboreum]|uniref:Zinc knuckle CX2CX4HX4C domain-containing protein n=1 Tax=Gossypium arboreum TaxID=29729 RepID=A0ABR0NSF1_GOSAR|nr:hypothetical protein PVK06_031728 [Gossypium arboreum]